MANKLFIIGIGPGSKDFIYPAAEKLIEGSDVLIGGNRNLDLFSNYDKEKIIIGNNLDEICTYIEKNIEDKRIVVLATGDPGIYSVKEFLKEKLGHLDIEVMPGISSLQYLCSKLKLNWNDIRITSLHGREEEDLPGIIKRNKKVAVFAGGKYKPDSICRELMEYGLAGIRVSVGENLSYTNERIVMGSPEEISKLQFDNLSIMIIENENAGNIVGKANEWRYNTPGLPDEMFIRGDVPMTKEEIRAISISKLRLESSSIVCDVGAGTGSVAIECALRCNLGIVFAVEKNKEAVELIHKNADKFDLTNIKVIHGEAPEALVDIPAPDRVFIGGSSGNMGEILEWAKSFDKRVRVVVNTVTVESTYEAIEGMESKGFEDVEIINISVSRGRKVGGKHLMQALNPVYVISGEWKG